MDTFKYEFQKRINITKEDVDKFVIEDIVYEKGEETGVSIEVDDEVIELVKPSFMESSEYNEEEYFIDITIYFHNLDMTNNQIVFGFTYCGDDVKEDFYKDNYYQFTGTGVESLYNKVMDYKKQNSFN